jgi:hypothetical protein
LVNVTKTPPPSDDTGLIAADVGSRLLMITPGQFEDVSRGGWFRAELKNPARYRLVDVVQGFIKSLQHELTRGHTAAEAAAHVDCTRPDTASGTANMMPCKKLS